MEGLVKEPYQLLLGQYENHPVMGHYLHSEVPAFNYLTNLLDMLSAEERIMVKVAFALHEEEVSATVRELLELSDVCFDRVVEALKIQRQK